MEEMSVSVKVNLIYGLFAQSITFLINIMMSFFLPRSLGVEKYAYWQLFIFYVSYVCFFHFGLPDGIYLINGGKKLEELDKNRIATQFRCMIFFQSIIAFLIATIGCTVVKEAFRKHVILLTSIYLLLVNFNNFYGMVYQAVNKAKWYSIGLLIDKLFFGCCITILLLKKEARFETYIIAYCIGRLLACFYSFFKCKELLTAKKQKNYSVLIDILSNIKIGSNLMLSVISSTLILGVGRAFIDGKWGIKTFGIFSFALTLSNFILQFINQISIVLFPALRNISEENLGIVYMRLRRYIDVVLGFIPIMYLPLSFLVNKWLPQYQGSMKYLVFLLPISFFDGKMQMLVTTYFKVLRKEKLMLKINLGILTYSIVITGMGVFFFENIWVATIGMISAIVIRSMIAEFFVEKELRIHVAMLKWIELLSFMLYWWGMLLCEIKWTLFLYGGCYIVINIWIYRKVKIKNCR